MAPAAATARDGELISKITWKRKSCRLLALWGTCLPATLHGAQNTLESPPTWSWRSLLDERWNIFKIYYQVQLPLIQLLLDDLDLDDWESSRTNYTAMRTASHGVTRHLDTSAKMPTNSSKQEQQEKGCWFLWFQTVWNLYRVQTTVNDTGPEQPETTPPQTFSTDDTIRSEQTGFPLLRHCFWAGQLQTKLLDRHVGPLSASFSSLVEEQA